MNTVNRLVELGTVRLSDGRSIPYRVREREDSLDSVVEYYNGEEWIEFRLITKVID